MATKQGSFRVLMFPWIDHGHISPYLELAKKLSNRNFHIYFCSTAINLDSIKKSLKKDKNNDDFSIELVELHLPSLPELPPHYHTTENLPPHLMPTLMKAFYMSSSNFSDIITNLKPDLLIHDVLQPWSAKLASSQCIPSVHFPTSGCTSFSFFLHWSTHKNCDTFPYRAITLKEHEKRDMSGPAHGVFELSRDIVLMNSCRGIEGKYIDYLSTLCDKKIVPTGPLVTRGGNREYADTEIINWLSQKSQCSTLYISFGSEHYLSKEQMREIAKGLELSNVNFIWVAQSPHGSENFVDEALPEGFDERVKQRGKIVKGWAPQAAILAHPNVGGFMSHCGWTYIMESIYHGVPVVAVPLKLDQPMNARVVVEVGVGVEVMRDENGQFDGEGVAKAINAVFVGVSGEGLRSKARELSKTMKMEEDEAIHEAAQELSKICERK